MAGSLNAQDSKKTFSFKKGQLFDVLFLNAKPNTQDKFDHYLKTVFPVAQKNGYSNLSFYSIGEDQTQGNYHPSAMIFGSWTSLASKQRFVNESKTALPKFHQWRREIWASFNLTYYELQEDFSFTIDSDKVNVVTAYWKKDGKNLNALKRSFEKSLEQYDGGVILTLENGNSPFGYYYNPDYFSITQWDSKEDFYKFQEENTAMDLSSVKHVNQFILD